MSRQNQEVLKVLYVSHHDPENMKSWSGTPHFIYEELVEAFERVEVCIPSSLGWFRFLSKVVKKLFSYVGSSSVDLTRTIFYSRRIATEISEKIKFVEPDLIVGVAASIELAFVETDIPIIHVSDATFAAMIGYYPEFSNIWPWLEAQGNAIENRIIQNANAVVCSSDWASESVINHYGAEDKKVFTLLLGANLKDLPHLSQDVIDNKFEGTCKLLFIGKEWHRKGGDIALDVFNLLRQANMDAEITIVSSQCPRQTNNSAITVIDGLSKDTDAGLDLFNTLFLESSFFLLPTRAEAFGLVYAEAAAFGSVAVGPSTGGVANIIEDNKTGLLLPASATAEEYAQRIIDIWENKDQLKSMSKAAREKFDTQLSWSHWGENFSKIAVDVVRARSE